MRGLYRPARTGRVDLRQSVSAGNPQARPVSCARRWRPARLASHGPTRIPVAPGVKVRKVQVLMTQGRMHPAGLAAFAARRLPYPEISRTARTACSTCSLVFTRLGANRA